MLARRHSPIFPLTAFVFFVNMILKLTAVFNVAWGACAKNYHIFYVPLHFEKQWPSLQLKCLLQKMNALALNEKLFYFLFS